MFSLTRQRFQKQQLFNLSRLVSRSQGSIVPRMASSSSSGFSCSNNNNLLSVTTSSSLLLTQPKCIESVRFQSSSPSISSYKCSACGKTFRLANALTHHINTKHGGEAKPIPIDSSGNPVGGTGSSSTTQQQQQTPSTTPGSASSSTATATAQQQQQPSSFSVSGGGGGGGIPVPNPQGVQQQQQQQENQISEEEFSKKAFVCTICGKSFRMENALLHHYKAKHGIDKAAENEAASGSVPPAPEAPTTTTTAAGTTTTSTDQAGNATTTSVSANDVAAAQQQQQQQKQQATTTTTTSSSSHQYQFHQQQQQQPAAGGATASSSETITSPLPPQYHLDVAPNAPEEREIAVHYNCVNNITLMGQVQDVTTGYVFEDKVLQFVVTTMFDNPSPGEPDRDFHTVRVYLPTDDDDQQQQQQEEKGREEVVQSSSSSFGNDIKQQLFPSSSSSSSNSTTTNNKRVLVSGRLRMVPQYEPTSGRYYHFPVVQVQQGSGYVRCV